MNLFLKGQRNKTFLHCGREKSIVVFRRRREIRKNGGVYGRNPIFIKRTSTVGGNTLWEKNIKAI